MFTRVLVPVDGSVDSTMAAQLAATLVGPAGEVTLLHVSPPPRGAAALFDSAAAIIGGAMGDLREKQALVESRIGTSILAEARAAIPASMRARTEERQGRPGGTILDQLEGQSYDGIVMGTRGRGRVVRAVLGSVSEGLVHSTSKPAIVARHASAASILVALDGSPCSKRALTESVILAERIGAVVSAVLVAEMIWEAPPEAQQAETANERREYESLLKEMTPFPAVRQRIVSFGDPAEAILAAANRTGADLIAVGRTGQTPHPRMSLGSTASRIASNAEASVLLVP